MEGLADLLGLLLQFGVVLGLIALGYFVGRFRELRHYSSIRRREESFLQLPALTFELETEKPPQEGTLVVGSVVISIDYFKRFLAGLRILVGGEVRSYSTLVDRARREAILRMKEAAPAGTLLIANLRLETSTIGNTTDKKNKVGSIEAYAYGTALVPAGGEG